MNAQPSLDEGHGGAEHALGPLARHGVLETDDVDEFRDRASKLLSQHRIRPRAAASDPFHGRVNAVGFDGVELVYLEQGAAVDVDILERIDYYDLMLAMAGSNRLELATGDDRAVVDAAGAALLSPSMRARMHMDADYRQMHLRIEQHALERRLEAMLGHQVRSPVRFDLAVDLTSPALSTWMSSFRLLLHDLDSDAGMTRHPLAAASWRDMLLTGLLLSHPHNHQSALREPDPPQVHRLALRAALDYIDDHLADPLTVGELAQHVGSSVRSLQRAFQENLGTTPRTYIQSLRLARVREDLLDAEPGAMQTVTDVAYRWGFVHLSRFAVAYRQRYGESPSQTRHRVAGI